MTEKLNKFIKENSMVALVATVIQFSFTLVVRFNMHSGGMLSNLLHSTLYIPLLMISLGCLIFGVVAFMTNNFFIYKVIAIVNLLTIIFYPMFIIGLIVNAIAAGVASYWPTKHLKKK